MRGLSDPSTYVCLEEADVVVAELQQRLARLPWLEAEGPGLHQAPLHRLLPLQAAGVQQGGQEGVGAGRGGLGHLGKRPH